MAAAAVAQQSHRSEKPLNRRVAPLVGASLGVSVARLSCKSVCAYLTGKTGRSMMNRFSMSLKTTKGSESLLAKITNIYV